MLQKFVAKMNLKDLAVAGHERGNGAYRSGAPDKDALLRERRKWVWDVPAGSSAKTGDSAL